MTKLTMLFGSLISLSMVAFPIDGDFTLKCGNNFEITRNGDRLVGKLGIYNINVFNPKQACQLRLIEGLPFGFCNTFEQWDPVSKGGTIHHRVEITYKHEKGHDVSIQHADIGYGSVHLPSIKFSRSPSSSQDHLDIEIHYSERDSSKLKMNLKKLNFSFSENDCTIL